MRISDNVANYILNLLEEENGIAEIQRNELAQVLGCVPSQINYVITSRFKPEHGYIIESRRGGGGYIRITRRKVSKTDMVMHIILTVGDNLDAGTCRSMIENMSRSKVITPHEAELLHAATCERTLSLIPREFRDCSRAVIFKNVLLVTEHST